jgi:hypothetical protein
MDVSESSLVKVFEMLVTRLSNIENRLDNIHGYLKTSERQRYGKLNMAIFGYPNVKLHKHNQGEPKDAAPETVRAIYVELGGDVEQYWEYTQQMMDGRFDHMFDDTVDLNRLKAYECQKSDEDRDMMTTKEVGIDSQYQSVWDFVAAKLMNEALQDVNATVIEHCSAIIFVSKNNCRYTIDEWCEKIIGMFHYMTKKHIPLDISVYDIHQRIPVRVLIEANVNALKSWADTMTYAKRIREGKRLLENNELDFLFISEDIRAAFRL